ncbi:MAG: hypothetical protein IPL70_03765 [Uliginosibacterium sp.]|nr:hypothetical protein [Uliginosibacterium sp.]
MNVVRLRDFEELTIAEIAERLNEPPGAIKGRMSGPYHRSGTSVCSATQHGGSRVEQPDRMWQCVNSPTLMAFPR